MLLKFTLPSIHSNNQKYGSLYYAQKSGLGGKKNNWILLLKNGKSI